MKPEFLTWPHQNEDRRQCNVDHHDIVTNIVGLVAEIDGEYPGPTYVLDAVVDTAPIGDAHLWTNGNPFSGHIEEVDAGASGANSRKLLYGRGAADSKVAAAIFIEVATALTKQKAEMQGKLVLFFDAAEHTGKFEGVKSFLRHYNPEDIAGVMIGYPGDNTLNIGSRGFERSTVNIQVGTMEGEDVGNYDATTITQSSVIKKLGQFLNTLQEFEFSECVDKELDFNLPPKRTLTALSTVSKETLVHVPKDHSQFRIRIGGTSFHSGSSRKHGGVNAIMKLAKILIGISESRLSSPSSPGNGKRNILILDLNTLNDGFSIIPDAVELVLAWYPTQITNEAEEEGPISDSLTQREAYEIISEVVDSIHGKYPSKGSSYVKLMSDEEKLQRQQLRIGPKEDDSFSLEVMSALSINIDTRTTPTLFGIQESQRHLSDIINKQLSKHTNNVIQQMSVSHQDAWPAFSLESDHPLRTSMEYAIQQVRSQQSPSSQTQHSTQPTIRSLTSKASGPSNVGNLLAKYGVPCTTGYGVFYENMHATNEHIDLATIYTTLDVYTTAVRHLLIREKE